MRIKWKNEDLGEYSGIPTVKECRFIKKQIGMLPNQFMAALDAADPEATAIMVAIMMARQGNDVDWTEIDGEFDDLVVEYTDAEKKAMKKAEAEAKKAAETEEGKGNSSVKLTTISGGKSDDSKTSTPRSRSTRRPSGSSSA